MAYTVMSTQVTGYVVLATDWNNIVNNFIASAPDVFTTDGDVFVGTGANAGERVAAFNASNLLIHEIGGLELDISGVISGDGFFGSGSGTVARNALVSQAQAEAGTDTTPRPWTAERVKQAIEALQTGGTLYGDGTDGVVTISSNTTLTADKQYKTLTVDSTYSLDVDGFLVQVSGTCTVNGTIDCDGAHPGTNPGGGSHAGSAGRSNNTYGGSGGGGTGGAASAGNGTAGTATNPSLGDSAGAGGNADAGGGTGAAGGAATQIEKGYGAVKAVPGLKQFDGTLIKGGAGGGGGGGDAAGNKGGGGGGGSGAGICVVLASTLVNNGAIQADGGLGGHAHGNSDGGGGGGGGGGYLLVVTEALSGAGTRTAAAGSGGNGGNNAGSNPGVAGTAGNVETLSLG